MFDTASTQPAFEQHLQSKGLEISRMTPADGVGAMLEFYRGMRAQGCSTEQGSDMLLVQWGTYDGGDGEYFEFNITRQLIIDDVPEDENIWQLSLTFRFPPNDGLLKLGRDDRWCERPSEMPAFEELIHQAPAYRAVSGRSDGYVSLDYECAG